jgi:hypothetical protein
MSDEPRQQMPKWWSYLKWGFLAFIVLVIVKVFWVLTGQPKPTVNYLKILNEQSKPADYNDQLNAAFDLQWAAWRYVDMPKDLERLDIDWPGDLDPNKLKELETWLDKNRSALEFYNKAAQKPYCWYERTAPDNDFSKLHWDDLHPMRQLTKLAWWKSRDLALHGDCNAAFTQLLSVYRLGQIRWGKCASMVEQLLAMSVRTGSVDMLSNILNRCTVDPCQLLSLQNKLEQLHQYDKYELDLSNDEIRFSDLIQRTFVYDRNGKGRIAFSKFSSIIDQVQTGNPSSAKLNSLLCIGQCFIGPTSKQMKIIFKQRITEFNQIQKLSPYDLHLKKPTAFDDMELKKQGAFLTQWFWPTMSSVYKFGFREKAQAEAVITVLGILRFKADTGHLPASLDDALAKGYIHFIPRDPYGPGPLTYKPKGDTFTLYSFGNNFQDDGGTPAKGSGRSFQSGPDLVFWPVKQPPKTPPNPPHRPVKTRL